MRVLLRVVAVTVVLVGLTGCGSAADKSATYVAVDTGTAVLVQWTAGPEGELDGSVRVTEAADQAGDLESDLVDSDALSMSGLRSGSSVSLTVDYGLGVTETWAGSVDGDELTLGLPQDDGTVQDIVLAEADTAAYNSAVEEITAAAAAAREEEIQAREEAEQAAAAQQQIAEQEEAAAAAFQAEQQQIADRDEAMESVISTGARLTSRGDLEELVTVAQDAARTHEEALAEAESAPCDARDEPLTRVGDAYSTLLDDLARVQEMVGIVRDDAMWAELAVEQASGLDVGEDLSSFSEEAAEARAVADAAELEALRLDEAAIEVDIDAFALGIC